MWCALYVASSAVCVCERVRAQRLVCVSICVSPYSWCGCMLWKTRANRKSFWFFFLLLFIVVSRCAVSTYRIHSPFMVRKWIRLRLSMPPFIFVVFVAVFVVVGAVTVDRSRLCCRHLLDTSDVRIYCVIWATTKNVGFFHFAHVYMRSNIPLLLHESMLWVAMKTKKKIVCYMKEFNETSCECC